MLAFFINCYNISVFIASTSICKSQLRFVSCGIFTQLNENSDSDSGTIELENKGPSCFFVIWMDGRMDAFMD